MSNNSNINRSIPSTLIVVSILATIFLFLVTLLIPRTPESNNVSSTSSTTTTTTTTTRLPLLSARAEKGTLTNAPDLQSILSTHDQTSQQDNPSKYISVLPSTPHGNFRATFTFLYDPPPPSRNHHLESTKRKLLLTTITIDTNTSGRSHRHQNRYFQIKNFVTGRWIFLGDNSHARDGIWHVQNFELTGDTLMECVEESSGEVWVRYNGVGVYSTMDDDDDAMGKDVVVPGNGVKMRGVGDDGGGKIDYLTVKFTFRGSIKNNINIQPPNMETFRPTNAPTTTPKLNNNHHIPTNSPSTIQPSTPIPTPFIVPTTTTTTTFTYTTHILPLLTVTPIMGEVNVYNKNMDFATLLSVPNYAPHSPFTSSKSTIEITSSSFSSVNNNSDDNNPYFVAQFEFDYDLGSKGDTSSVTEVITTGGEEEEEDEGGVTTSTTTTTDTAMSEIRVKANTLGVEKQRQRRYFQVEKRGRINKKMMNDTHQIEEWGEGTTTWEEIGDNDGGGDWVWYSQTFSLAATLDDRTGGINPNSDIDVLANFNATSSSSYLSLLKDYVNPDTKKLTLWYGSDNNINVSHVDFIEVSVTIEKKRTMVQTTLAPSPPPPPPAASTPTITTNTIHNTQQQEAWWRPKASHHLTWQYQLKGPLDTSYPVDVYNIDLFSTTPQQIASLKQQQQRHTIVICNFSAGTYENWTPDWPSYFPFIKNDFTFYNGNEPPFAGIRSKVNSNRRKRRERWLDIRRIDLLEPILQNRIRLAKSKGCDAIEPDHVDAYSKGIETKLNLTYEDQLRFNLWLASMAHRVGLSVGLKNDVGQLDILADAFDWALNDQVSCWDRKEGGQYYQCGERYKKFFIDHGDKTVFRVDYGEGEVEDLNKVCEEAIRNNVSWLRKEEDLLSWRQGCEDFV